MAKVSLFQLGETGEGGHKAESERACVHLPVGIMGFGAGNAVNINSNVDGGDSQGEVCVCVCVNARLWTMVEKTVTASAACDKGMLGSPKGVTYVRMECDGV